MMYWGLLSKLQKSLPVRRWLSGPLKEEPPTTVPTAAPTTAPTAAPTVAPTSAPTAAPTAAP